MIACLDKKSTEAALCPLPMNNLLNKETIGDFYMDQNKSNCEFTDVGGKAIYFAILLNEMGQAYYVLATQRATEAKPNGGGQ